MKKMILIAALLASLTACSQGKPDDLHSPCVGSEGSPCDRRVPANNQV